MSGSMEGASPPPQADDSDVLDAQLYLDEPGDAPHAAQEDAPRLAVRVPGQYPGRNPPPVSRAYRA